MFRLGVESSRLKRLEINVIASGIFPRPILKLDSVVYTNTHTTRNTFSQIIAGRIASDSNLRIITLQNFLNMESVRPDNISNAIKHLDHFILETQTLVLNVE